MARRSATVAEVASQQRFCTHGKTYNMNINSFKYCTRIYFANHKMPPRRRGTRVCVALASTYVNMYYVPWYKT